MAQTGITDDHTHNYQGGPNRSITSNDNGHSHVVPPWPATRTEVANDHQHDLPERIT